MPDATPTSTAPSSRARRNRLWRAAQIIVAAIIVWYAGKSLVGQWEKFRHTPFTAQPRWAMIALAAGLTLAAFGVLIETWRRMVIAWGDRIDFVDAAQIFFQSSLVRYAPGSTALQIPAMAELSRRRGVAPATAASASVINTGVNIVTGFVVALIAGYRAVDVMFRGQAAIGLVIAAIMLGGLLALPALLPYVLRILHSATGRTLIGGRLPMRAIYISLIGNVVGWVLYGLSYRSLVAGVIGSADGSTAEYVAVYAGAYVLGYLVFLVPAGFGVRETVQVDALTKLALVATGPQAAVVSIAARLLTMTLEIVPGLLFLSRGTRPPRKEPTTTNGPHA